MANLTGIKLNFQTLVGDGKFGDTLLHVFVKNRKSDTSTPESSTTFVANNLEFIRLDNVGANERNPYLGKAEFALLGQAFAPGSSVDCPITLRTTLVPQEEIVLPVVNIHILAARENTWMFNYTVDFLFDDSAANFSFSSVSTTPAGIALDKEKRDYSGICSENPIALPPPANKLMDPVLTQLTIDFRTNGAAKAPSTPVFLQVVNRLGAAFNKDILKRREILPGQAFPDDGTAIQYATGDPDKAELSQTRLQDIVLPVVHITAAPTGSETWKFDYRVTYYFSSGTVAKALTYSSTTNGVVLNSTVLTHLGVYNGSSFPSFPPIAVADWKGAPVGERVKTIPIDFLNKKLNDFVNARQGIDPDIANPALIKLRLHNSQVIGSPNPASYYDIQSLVSDQPAPGFIANSNYKEPVRWSSSTVDLGQLNASLGPINSDYYFYDINSSQLTLKADLSGTAPLVLFIAFETGGQKEIQGGDLADADLTTFEIKLLLGLTHSLKYNNNSHLDLMSWVDEIPDPDNFKVTIPWTPKAQGEITGTLFGKEMKIPFVPLPGESDDSVLQRIRKGLYPQIVNINLESENKFPGKTAAIAGEIQGKILDGLLTLDKLTGLTPRDQINAFFNSWLLGGIIEGDQGVVPGDNSCKVTNLTVDPVANALQITYTGPNYTFGFETPVAWPQGRDFSPGTLANIDHIVVLTMENRSFDHMMGYLSLSVENGGMGRTEVDGLNGNQINVIVTPVGTQVCKSTALSVGETAFAPDPPHSYEPVQAAINGGAMDGFAQACADEHTVSVGPNIMKYQPPANVPVFDTLVRDFALCHRWFASHPGPTFPNRYYELTGRPNIDAQGFWELSNSSTKRPAFTKTIFDWLTDAGVSWSYFEDYYCFLRFFERHTFNTTNIFDFDDPFLGFAKTAALRKLPSVTFIDPHFIEFPPNANCDGPPADIQRGQQLVDKVVQALISSPTWNKTLLIITYDEHGGFYDHVAPPAAVPIANKLPNTFGVRVPTIVVSPWVDNGIVFGHDAPNDRPAPSLYFDHTSILKTIARRFLSTNPPYMGPRFAAANDLSAVIGNQLRPGPFLPYLPYYLTYAGSYQRLEVPGGSNAAGIRLSQNVSNDCAAQQFSFEGAGQGSFYIRTHTGGLYVTLDVPTGSDANSLPVLNIKQDVKYNAAANPSYQRWSFVPVVDKYGAPGFEIQNTALPNRVLHVQSESLAAGASVVLEDVGSSGSPATRCLWRIVCPSVSGAAVSPAFLQFAQTNVGISAPQQTLTVSVTPGASLVINSVAILNDDGSVNTDFMSVPPSGSPPPSGTINIQDNQLVVTVFFHPSQAGPRNAALVITHNLANSPLVIGLSGIGNAIPIPILSHTPASLNFSRKAPMQTVNLKNIGSGPLDITGISVQGSSSYHFTSSFGSGAGTGVLQPGETCTVTVTYTFAGAGGSSYLVISHDGVRTMIDMEAGSL